MKKDIEKIIEDSIAVKRKLLNKNSVDKISKVVRLVRFALKKGGKVILFGNGGSCTDSQHIAAEFVGRFKTERRSLPAIALTDNTAAITAIANDYGYENIFSRQLSALARRSDIAIGISTSGNAKNVINGLKEAKRMRLVTVGLTGNDGGMIAKIADISLIVSSNITARIQESHITIGHIICELAEKGY